MFWLKKIFQNKKKQKTKPTALPFHCLASPGTKSPSNQDKMKRVALGNRQMRKYTTHEEEEERGEVKVKSKYRVQTVSHLGEGVWKGTGWFLRAWWVWCLSLCSASKPPTLLLSCQVNNTNKSWQRAYAYYPPLFLLHFKCQRHPRESGGSHSMKPQS